MPTCLRCALRLIVWWLLMGDRMDPESVEQILFVLGLLVAAVSIAALFVLWMLP